MSIGIFFSSEFSFSCDAHPTNHAFIALRLQASPQPFRRRSRAVSIDVFFFSCEFSSLRDARPTNHAFIALRLQANPQPFRRRSRAVSIDVFFFSCEFSFLRDARPTNHAFIALCLQANPQPFRRRSRAVSVDILCTRTHLSEASQTQHVGIALRPQANPHPSHLVCRQLCRRRSRAVSLPRLRRPTPRRDAKISVTVADGASSTPGRASVTVPSVSAATTTAIASTRARKPLTSTRGLGVLRDGVSPRPLFAASLVAAPLC